MIYNLNAITLTQLYESVLKLRIS